MTRRGRRMQPERAMVRRFPVPQRRFEPNPAPADKLLMSPAQRYASEKLGKVITTENEHLCTEAEKAAWRAALEEYRMPPERVSAVFLSLKQYCVGAPPEDIICFSLAFALSEAFESGVSSDRFTELLNTVLQAHTVAKGSLR